MSDFAAMAFGAVCAGTPIWSFQWHPHAAEAESTRSIAAPPLKSAAWVEDLYSAVRKGDETLALDLVYRHFDECLAAGKFKDADGFFSVLDLERMNTVTLLAVLSITSAAAVKLPKRKLFAERAASRVRNEEGDRAEALLAGLL